MTIRVKTMDSNEFAVKVRNPYKSNEVQQVEREAASPAVKVTSIKEAIRSNDSHISCINFLLSCNPKNASKVVEMAVCINDRMDWSLSQYVICKGETCCSRGTRCEWINDKPPVRGFYKSYI